MITLRPYQAQSVDAVFDYWKSGGGSPVVDLATGLGKSLVTAEICRRALEVSPDMRIMMLVHIRELVKQNYQQMLKVWPEAPVGIYSAGLSKRDVHHKIIFASIQSFFQARRLRAASPGRDRRSAPCPEGRWKGRRHVQSIPSGASRRLSRRQALRSDSDALPDGQRRPCRRRRRSLRQDRL